MSTAAEVIVVDPKGRVTLPEGFANTTVRVEAVSETEVRIRKAGVVPEDEVSFIEENLLPLSVRDVEALIEILETPREPGPALRAAVARYKQQHG